MTEDKRILNLSRDALSRLGREECTVIIVADGVTDLNEGYGWRSVPNLGIRATDKSGLSARINFELLPEEDDLIREN